MPRSDKYDALASVPGAIPKPGPKVRTPRNEVRRAKGLSKKRTERRDWLLADQYGEAAPVVRAMHCVGCYPGAYRTAERTMGEVAAAFGRVQHAIGLGVDPPVFSDPHHVHTRAHSDSTDLVPACRTCHDEADDRAAFEAKHSLDLDCVARWIAGPIVLLLESPDPSPEAPNDE